ncbi:type IV toxin-antitoxin system AbiEi family antitoxin domain-containing protein [Prevotella sp. P5-92]|uniref:type IV toxin-antitoxin system AbiEi family antitoxin domain-containing protein n=1 Tax=Prevotella sp. P5-92 TaxID=2024222 RepID=UPI0026ABB994
MRNITIIDELQKSGGFIKASEVKTRGEYEQLRRATEEGTLLRLRNGVYVET